MPLLASETDEKSRIFPAFFSATSILMYLESQARGSTLTPVTKNYIVFVQSFQCVFAVTHPNRAYINDTILPRGLGW